MSVYVYHVSGKQTQMLYIYMNVNVEYMYK